MSFGGFQLSFALEVAFEFDALLACHLCESLDHLVEDVRRDVPHCSVWKRVAWLNRKRLTLCEIVSRLYFVLFAGNKSNMHKHSLRVRPIVDFHMVRIFLSTRTAVLDRLRELG